MVRTNRISTWVNNFSRRNPINPAPIQPIVLKQNQRMLILLTTDANNLSEQFCKFIINNGFVNSNIDVYKTNKLQEENLINIMQNFYNDGYRLFITYHNSSQFQSLFDWLNNNKDVVYINTASTVASDIFISSIPSNSFRASMNDLNALKVLLYEILPNLKAALVPNGNKELYISLPDASGNTPTFKNIIYIYDPSLYTTSYKETIQFLIDNYEYKDLLNFVPIELDPTSSLLPDNAKYYLTFNNVNQSGYYNSTEKPLIIINTMDPQSLLNRFTEEEYYDNYFITGDIFTTGVYTSKYEFKYAFALVSAFSSGGYKLSYYVDKTQSISPQILVMYNLCSELGTIFNENINSNKNFIASKFLDRLKFFNLIQNNYWYDLYVTLPTLTYENDVEEENHEGPHEITYDLSIIKSKSGTDTYLVAVNKDYTLNYDLMAFTEPLLSWQQNINKINSYKPNASTILTNEYDIFNLPDDFNKYKFFLNDNYSRDLPEKIYARYYCFKTTEQYKIPIINIDLSYSLTGYVSQQVNNLQNSNNKIDRNLTLTIPVLSYIKLISDYDLLTNEYKSLQDDEIVDIPSFNVNLTDAIKEFDLYIYKGNIVRLIEDNTSITVKETLTSYIKVHINVNWLVIKQKYTVGSIVTKISDNTEATVVSIDQVNFFNLTITYNVLDESGTPISVTENVTQDDVNPIGLLEQNTTPIIQLE